MKKSELALVEYIINSARKKAKRGKNPSLPYKGERNPRKALAMAVSDYDKEPKVPKISDADLKKRMSQIHWVVQGMSGVDGKFYGTEEQDKNLFDLFSVTVSCDPRTQAFNFTDDKDRVVGQKALGLEELAIKNIFVKTGGYYGFCKITLAEVMSQIPEEILGSVVAFALNPEIAPQNVNDAYQVASIIFYGQGEIADPKTNDLPSFKDLIAPVNLEKAIKLKDVVRPIINWRDTGYSFIDPGNIEESFIDVGIWLRKNGSNLHRYNTETKVDVPHKVVKKISVYQAFGERGADYFNPNYAYTISQIPDELINERTIGFVYHSTDYFKTKEGVLHKTEYSLVEKI